MHLDPAYSGKEERIRALQDLGRAAYAAINVKLHGSSVAEADLPGFWRLINLKAQSERPGLSSTGEDVLRRVLRCFTDNEWWVRRAAVEAARECTKEWDRAIADALEGMLEDRSLAVRSAAVKALEDLCAAGDPAASGLLIGKLDDSSRIVRLAAVRALRKFIRPGDRKATRELVTWLRHAWEHTRSRGNDTEVKLALADLILHVLLFRDTRHSGPFLAGLRGDSLHHQRNAIARFEEHLTHQGLIEPFRWHEDDARRRRAPADTGYGEQHWRAALMIQRVARRLTRGRRRASSEPWWLRFKRTREGPPDPARALASIKDFRRNEDAIAHKIICLQVPLEIKGAAINWAVTHAAPGGGMPAGQGGGPDEGCAPWEWMRWTERLRLCEEVAGHSWPVPPILQDEFGV
jgi:hypothetical protein